MGREIVTVETLGSLHFCFKGLCNHYFFEV
jgi:hypothetical protein